MRLFENAGRMTDHYRAVDWSRTPLGPIDRWPRSLRTCVRIVLTSRQPMFVWWGDALTNLYNEAYCTILGGKHPWALGQPASLVWREIWSEVGPRAETTMRGNAGTYDEALLLIMERNGYPEETYYTFSYSPVPNDEGGIGGIICANTEDTQRIVGARQLTTLRELAARTGEARTLPEAAALAANALAADPRDLPFAAIYLLDSERRVAVLGGATGVSVPHDAVPARISLDGTSPWPIAEVARTGSRRVVDVNPALGRLPSGAWDAPPRRVAVLPIAASGEPRCAAVLVVGLNPFRLLDDGYAGFLDLVAGQCAAALSNARAYEEEKERVEAFAALDRAKTTFFSNVSHELRTPLTLLLSPVEDALASPGGVPDREQTGLIHRSALRLLKLVNSLLDFARIEAGRARACPRPLDLALATAEVASTFRSLMEKAGLAFVVDAPPLAAPVPVDRDMWEKIVLNLLSNAFKFTFAGEVAVVVRDRGNAVDVSVRDTGIGIPGSELPRLFDRFHRVEGARGRTQEGTGIGLALVQELVKLHGGSVAVESVVGLGTTFTVSIPRSAAPAPGDAEVAPAPAASTAIRAEAYVEEARRWLPSDLDGATAPPAAPGAAEVPARAGAAPRPRVLLADDNSDMRAYVARLLSHAYSVETAPDGEAALAAARARLPDLVLSDVMMPRLDGFGLLRELRRDARTKTIPIILLSARAGEESRIEGIGAGADDYLVKPFHARELLARVGAQLELARVRERAALEVRTTREQFATALEAAHMGAWSWDIRSGEVVWSPAMFELLGYEPGVEPTYEAWRRRVHPEDLARVESELRRALERHAGFRIDYRVIVPDGTVRGIQAHGRVQSADAEGRAQILDGVLVDMTERKRIESALKDADRRKDEFLAMLAHELRNPLAPITTALHLVRARAGPREELERPLAVLARQTQHLARLVDDLLEVSRITRGKIRLERETLDAATAVARAVEISRPLIDARGHSLSVVLPDEPVWLEADLTRLAQILGNLLNNAAKYTDDGGSIVLSVGREGRDAVFHVRDDGIGIAPELLPKLFELFTQADTSLARSQGGLGIGLTLVRGLVELHGGTVEARSEGRGQGSEFVVRLPALAAGAPSSPEAGSIDRLRGPAPCRVVVVDDNADAAESLAELLAASGHDVRVAYDGPTALEAVRAQAPDVVLLDIGLPRMDGFEVARRLRDEHGDSIRLVALTGYGQEEDRRRTREAGFDHHLVKPPSVAALASVLALPGASRT